MTTTTHDTEMARAHLEEAREHYEMFQESMRALGREVRRLDEWQYQRVDAYPGWEGTRDVGAGVDMAGWLDEIEAFLDGQDEGSDEDGPGDAPDPVAHADELMRSRERDAAKARALRAGGQSLYAIATELGRSKEWLRTYAGITD